MKHMVLISRITTVVLMIWACSIPARSSSMDSTKKSFRFVVLADSRGDDHGINSVIVRKTLEQVKGLNPQPLFAFVPGDLVNGSKDTDNLRGQFQYFKKTITEYYPMEFYHVGLGNHEVMHNKAGEKLFARTFIELKENFLCGYNNTVYFFDYGNARFFMLNNDHPGEEHIIADRQMNWVRKNLKPEKAHYIFFMHEPSYPVGYNTGNSMDVDAYLRNRFWDLVDSLNSAIVFNGHEHFYSRRHINREYNETINGRKFEYDKEVYQVTVGGFGGPLAVNFVDKPGVDVPPIGEYHFAVIDIHDAGMEVTVNNLDGKQLDHFIVP
jgi:hypothetical protein